MKVNFTKKAMAAILSLSLIAPVGVVMTSTTAHAITVFDPAVFARQLQQLNEAKRQYDQAKATYDQFRGSRDIGVLFNQYGSQMPKEMQDMYRDYQSGNWAGLADKVARLEKSQQLTGTQKEQLSQIANQAKMQALGNKAVLDDMFAKSNQRFAQIQRMANSVDLQKDPKAAADLLNRIQVEIAMIQLQSNQLQMMNMLMQAEKEAQRQAAIERRRGFSGSGGTAHTWQ
ncbi:hypothetical protein LP109_14605 (plasmid) [Moraxella bovis]|uniref:P-type DNA transfer protein VirB5 n=1 Tax=Moraxella bovis TaxID=476 RepID=A0ABY6MBT2_MORBO|nr:type IV secretion system protein [Moraxella bovis]UYZ77110.1 hypothetical protein LP093_14020 [Moraxella bovis]UYZ79767.1 hypothetical protein LP115_14150 [Moraxella bovis]UYZ88271.1 hypothetical protein LP094_14120 [Moraxella bovis]UYZ90983.1 hypothetical protein LP114_14415 [Moraxella bovis]UYZ99213.1 hypothetical protein LP107_14165 [Moraxella bovis]